MSKNASNERQTAELVNNCRHTIHQSLEEIQKAIVLLDDATLGETTTEVFPESIEAVQDIVNELLQQFQDLDGQIQATLLKGRLQRHHHELAEKANIKHIVSNWLFKDSLDQSA